MTVNSMAVHTGQQEWINRLQYVCGIRWSSLGETEAMVRKGVGGLGSAILKGSITDEMEGWVGDLILKEPVSPYSFSENDIAKASSPRRLAASFLVWERM